jgi:hypothetical protein
MCCKPTRAKIYLNRCVIVCQEKIEWIYRIVNKCGSLQMVLLDTFTRGPIATTTLSVHNPKNFPNPKIQATRHLTPKSQIPFRIVPENGSAVPISIQQRDLTAVKINAELPLESIL